MDTEDIKIFQAVVKAQGITAGARLLNIPKSKVSRRIRKLEEELGVALFQRSTRTLSLTDVGHRFYTRSTEMLHELNILLNSIQRDYQEPSGKVRVQTFPEAEITIPLLKGFMDAYPKIELEAVTSNQNVDLIANGLDLAMALGPQRSSDLITKKICTVRFEVFTTQEYLDSAPPLNTPADLANHECIVWRWPNGQLETTWQLPSQPPVEIKGHFITSDSNAIQKATLLGAGISKLPSSMCDGVPGLVKPFPDLPPILEDIWLVYPSKERLSHATRLLINWMSEHLPASI